MVKSNKSIIVANWKMNMNPSKFSEYFKSLINNLPEESDIIICPPNIYLKEIKDISIRIAMDSVKKIITTSVDKTKLDGLFNKNLEETKEALKKINS